MIKKLFLVSFALVLFIVCTEEENLPPTLSAPTLLSPSNGSTITQNPPTFIWSKVNEEGIVYRLEVASDTAFTTGSICISTAVMLPDTQYTPDSVLAVGTYYWHMCTREDC